MIFQAVIKMLPFELIVNGKPVSNQTRDRKRLQAWKQQVRQAAKSYWITDNLVGDSLRIIIVNYYEAIAGTEIVPDSSNLI